MCKSFGTNPDIIEIDAASNNGVDEIREIINNVRLAPANSKYKVYIVDEFHMLSTSAFNALLLTLEEPPSNVVFILATTDIQSVPITVLSRCQRFDFKPISVDDIVNRLNYVCNEEKIDITDAALKEIAYMSNGGMRDALSILDQISSRNTKIDVDDVTSNFGSISNKKVKEFMDVFTSGDVKGTLELLKEFKNNGIDVRILIEKLIDRIKSILIDIKLDNYNGILDFDMLYSMVFELNRVLQEIKSNIDPYNFLEIVILKYFPGNKISSKDFKDPVEEKKSGSTLKIEQKVEERPTKENISQEIKESKEPEINNEAPIVNEKKAHFNVDARINNTFVGAQKKYLLELKEKWDDFVIYESNANKLLLSYIVDTELVAASNNYAVLVNKINNTNDLINENIESVEKDFKIFFGREYKLVSISPKVWEEARNKYIANLKSGYKYTMMDDSIIIEENTSELEKLANEIFGNNYETK